MNQMTSSGTEPKIIFDDWRTIAFAVFMALVGYSVMVTVPVLSTALVKSLSFTEEQVGRVWGNDMLGLSIGAILCAFTVAKVDRRNLVTAGIILTVAANVMCMYLTDYSSVFWLRLMAGIGSGIFTGTAVATLGGATNTVRAFNLLLLGFAFSTALEIQLFSRFTLNSIYWFLIGSAAVCGLFLRWLPRRPLNVEEQAFQHSIEDQSEDWRVPKILPALCLVAVCFTYINIGGYYTYVELAALADGVAQTFITPVFTWSSVLALVGVILAWWCTRFGMFPPLLIALLILGVSVAMLAFGVGNARLAFSVFVFYTAWTFIDVYQTAIMGYMDRSGALVALVPSVQGFGQFVGPNIAASIIGAGLGYGVMFTVSGGMALVAMAIYGGIYYYMHHRKLNAVETVTGKPGYNET
jgi:predicted MFS family arabinose efflux permease